jgi:hypothetical protein
MAAEQIGSAGNCLIEESFVLHRLAEDDAKHALVPRVSDAFNAIAPAIHESLGPFRIICQDRQVCLAALP